MKLSELERAVLRNIVGGRKPDDQRTIHGFTRPGAIQAWRRLYKKGALEGNDLITQECFFHFFMPWMATAIAKAARKAGRLGAK